MEQSTCSAVIDELGLRPEEDSEEDHNKEKKKIHIHILIRCDSHWIKGLEMIH